MLLVLGTTQLLTRKWCLAEIVTARLWDVAQELKFCLRFSGRTWGRSLDTEGYGVGEHMTSIHAIPATEFRFELPRP